ARVSLALAKDASVRANAGFLDPLLELEDEHWVHVALLERRERDAQTAHLRGERRRDRSLRWKRALGIRPKERIADVPPTVHEATVSYLGQAAEHDSSEDIHPSRLDPLQADLRDALARSTQAKDDQARDVLDA